MPPDSTHQMAPDGKFSYRKIDIQPIKHNHIWEKSASNERGEIWEYCRICGNERDQRKNSGINAQKFIIEKIEKRTSTDPKLSILVGFGFLVLALLSIISIFFIIDTPITEFLKYGLFIFAIMLISIGIMIIINREKE